jgi:hypothetical protein
MRLELRVSCADCVKPTQWPPWRWTRPCDECGHPCNYWLYRSNTLAPPDRRYKTYTLPHLVRFDLTIRSEEQRRAAVEP